MHPCIHPVTHVYMHAQVSFYNPKRRRVVTVNKDRAVVKRINKTKSADINESNIPPTYFNLAGKRALALDGRG